MVTYSHIAEGHTLLPLLFTGNFSKGKELLEFAFHRDVCIRSYMFLSFVLSLTAFIIFRQDLVNMNMSVTFYFILCSIAAFLLGHGHLIHHIQSCGLMFLFGVIVSKIGLIFISNASFLSFKHCVRLPSSDISLKFLLIFVLQFPIFFFFFYVEGLVTTNGLKTT